MATTLGQPEIDTVAAYGLRTAEPPPPVKEVSILDILLVLARRRRFVVLVTFGCGVAGLLLALLMRPTFTAVTVILPPQNSGGTGSAMMSELSSLGALGGLASGGLGLKSQGDMYVALFKSETVENGLIRQFDLQHEYKDKYLSIARKDLEGHVKVTADTKTTLITIKVEDHDPRRAAAIANAYVDQYRHLSEHLAISEAAQRRLFFQQQLLQTKDKLGDAEDALVKTEQTTGMMEVDSQARALIASAASLRAEITAKQVQIEGMQTFAASDNAGLVQAQKELGGLKAELAKMGGNSDPDSDDFLVPKGRVPTAALAYARKLRDVKYYETIFNILARQFELAKLDEAREGALVQVVDPATVPDRKSSPKRALWTLVALVLGFLISSGIVLWQAMMRFLHGDADTDGKLRELRGLLRRRQKLLEHRT